MAPRRVGRAAGFDSGTSISNRCLGHIKAATEPTHRSFLEVGLAVHASAAIF